MSSVRGNPQSLRELGKRLQRVSKVAAQRVATAAASPITGLAQAAYGGGATVYGEARPSGVAGNALTLVKTGATRSDLRFVSIGTIVRARLGTRWARYLVGKYRILPLGPLPVAWSKSIAVAARAVLGAELGQ